MFKIFSIFINTFLQSFGITVTHCMTKFSNTVQIIECVVNVIFQFVKSTRLSRISSYYYSKQEHNADRNLILQMLLNYEIEVVSIHNYTKQNAWMK